MLALGVNHAGVLERNRQGEALIRQLKAWGFNNLGYDGPASLESEFPYFAAITTAAVEKHRSDPKPGSRNSYSFPDVFDPEWVQSLDRLMAQGCSRHRDNPNLVGYFWTDTPTWDLIRTRALRGTDWVSEIRRLPAGAPGRQRYAGFLAGRYQGRLADLNSFYGLNLEGMDALASEDLSRVAIGRHAVRADDEAFLAVIAQAYYSAVGQAQRKHDPSHLVFGDRYLAGDAPASVLKAAAPYIDAVAVQPGDRYTELYPPSTVYPEEEIERMHRLTGKPVLICDHAISFPVPGNPDTIFEQAPDEAAAARATSEFLRRAMSKPYVIGYLRCQYIDRPAAFGRGLRQGLVDVNGRPRKAMVECYASAFKEWAALIGSRSR